jgi:hypothetical protein
VEARVIGEASLQPVATPPFPSLHLACLCWLPLRWLAGLQVMAHADTAFFMGYLDPQQRMRAMAMQLETVQLISAGEEAGCLTSGPWLPHPRALCVPASWHQLCCAQLAAAICHPVLSRVCPPATAGVATDNNAGCCSRLLLQACGRRPTACARGCSSMCAAPPGLPRCWTCAGGLPAGARKGTRSRALL